MAGRWPEISEGAFWTSNDASTRCRGELRTHEGRHPEVTVQPGLFSGYREHVVVGTHGETHTTLTEDDPGPVTLHGDLDDVGPVTVLDAHSTRWDGSWPGDVQQQTFSGIRAVTGGHLSSSDHRFQALRLSLQTLPAMRLTADESSQGVALGNGGRLLYRLGEPGAFELTHIPPASLPLLDRTYLQPLLSLLQLATGISTAPMSVAVSERQNGGPWWPMHTASLKFEDIAVAPTVLLIPRRFHLRHAAAWLDQVERLGPLPAAAASVLTRPLAIEQQVLTLATVTEGLHRRLHPDAQRLPGNIAHRARSAATAAVDLKAPEASDTVRGLLLHMHEPGFAQRLTELAQDVEMLVPGITGRSARWKRLIYETRNDMAHQTGPGWLSERDLDRYVTAAMSLKWVLRALLLREADVPPETLAALFTDHQGYRLFLDQAAGMQPRVFGSN